MAEVNNQGFGWDDEVEESAFEVMPDGDYKFEITGFERGWWEPQRSDSKIPACNQAEIEMTIRWTNKDGQTRTNKLTYKLKLVRNLQFLIYQLFESVGLRKKGDGTTKMPWNQLIGTVGICQIGHHESSQGNVFNDVIKCYTPDSVPTVISNADTEDEELEL